MMCTSTPSTLYTDRKQIRDNSSECVCVCVCVCTVHSDEYQMQAFPLLVQASSELAKSPCSPPTRLNTSTHTHPHTLQNSCPLILLHPRLRGGRSCRLTHFWLVLLCFISLLFLFSTLGLCTHAVA